MPGVRRGLLVAGAVMVLAAQTQTTFYAAFADAQEAMRQGQWRAGLGALERAVQLRPAPAARVIIYGNNLLANYYPYSLIARCHLELGETDKAADWLGKAEAQGEPASVRDPVAHSLAARRGEMAPPSPQLVEVKRPEPPPARHVEPGPPAPEGPGPQVPPAPAAGAKAGPADPGAHRPGPAQADPGPGKREPVPSGVPPLPLWVSPSLPAQSVAAAPSQLRRPEPIRPLPPVFWASAGGGLVVLAALAAGKGWKRRRRHPLLGTAPPALGAFPETVGPYRGLRILGHGGFATTYLATHQSTGQEVALKVLHPHRLNDPDFRSRFSQEARIGARLDHPHLARLLDPGDPESPGWIALEYVPGPTLEAYLKERRALPLEEAASIALGIAEAMAYAHTLGVVHRDLKPANVILSRKGPKVMDLGIARELDAPGLTTTYAFLGTPIYAAPEAQFMAKAGPAADRYSLGVILFEMLAGRQPFHGETPFAVMDQHRSAPVPDLRELYGIPSALARLVERLLEKRPEDRPEDGELVAKLKSFAAPSDPG